VSGIPRCGAIPAILTSFIAELREANADAQLADAQFELAKQYECSSWRALKTRGAPVNWRSPPRAASQLEWRLRASWTQTGAAHFRSGAKMPQALIRENSDRCRTQHYSRT
jgi:hypothetical protein